MFLEEDIRDSLRPLDVVGVVTVSQFRAYVCKVLKKSDAYANALFLDLRNNYKIYTQNDIIYGIQTSEFERKMCVAFWVYIRFIHDACPNKLFIPDYPGTLAFVDSADGKETVYEIITCDSKNYDTDMVSLCEKKKNPNVKYIIAGINMDLQEIDKSMIPDIDFIFAKVIFSDLIKEEPEIIWQTHSSEGQNEHKGIEASS